MAGKHSKSKEENKQVKQQQQKIKEQVDVQTEEDMDDDQIDQGNLKRRNKNSVDDVLQNAGGDIKPVKQRKVSEQLDSGDDGEQSDGDGSDDDNDQIKWTYLQHKGVRFPPFYQPHKKALLYDNKKVELTDFQEQICTFWAQFVETQWAEKKFYRQNFSELLLDSFPKGHPYQDFNKFDFSNISNYLKQKTEQRKNRSKQEKLKQKTEKEDIAFDYGYAILDGKLEKMGNFLIEPPTLFKGRGEHPGAGRLKKRTFPEDITLNIAVNAPIPQCHLEGHAWKQIVNQPQVTWLAGYHEESVKKSHQYIFLAASSSLKGQNDQKKYEKARKLKEKIKEVREGYEQLLESKSKKQRQLSTATYLIDRFALRVGNQKGDDEADTVGCCSLRCEHITEMQVEGNQYYITLDFLGKDSIRYKNTIKIEKIVWKNIKEFTQNKKQDSDVFDSIDASNLNDYLKELMEGLTAKVFRTYNASSTLQSELDQTGEFFKEKGKQLTEKEKFEKYEQANKQVAILCNHQKTVGKAVTEKLASKEREIEIYRTYINELSAHIKGNCKKRRSETVVVEKEQGNTQEKTFVKEFSDNKQAAEKELSKIQDLVEKMQRELTQKKDNKDISLGTSQTNYNDPRITVAWCQLHEVSIEKPFSKTLRGKFLWAMETPSDWKF